MSGPTHRRAHRRTGGAAAIVGLGLAVAALAGCSNGGSDRSAPSITMGAGSGTASTTSTSVGATGTPGAGGGVASTSSTVTPRSTEPPPTGNTRDDFATAISQSLRSTVPEGVVSRDQTNCVAQLAVDAIGVEAFTSRGLTAAAVASPSFSFASLGMDLDVANQVVDAYATCGIDMRSLIQIAVASVVSPVQAECVNAKIDDEVGRQILVELLAYGVNTSEMQAKTRAVGRECGIKLG